MVDEDTKLLPVAKIAGKEFLVDRLTCRGVKAKLLFGRQPIEQVQKDFVFCAF